MVEVGQFHTNNGKVTMFVFAPFFEHGFLVSMHGFFHGLFHSTILSYSYSTLMGVAHFLFYYLLRELLGDQTPLWVMEVVVYHQVGPRDDI